ncbi:hypothetical protein C7G66_19030, partial [Acinetobacter baumannii]
MLQVGAKALELQGSPDEDLVNAAGVLRPFGEHVGRGLVCLLGLLDGAAGLPEDDRTVGSLESLESGVHGIPSTDALEDALGLLDDDVPELLVLLAEHKGEAGGLCVVRRGSKGENLLQDLLNAAVGDRRRGLEAVDSTSKLGSSQELVGGDGRSHCVECVGGMVRNRESQVL